MPTPKRQAQPARHSHTPERIQFACANQETPPEHAAQGAFPGLGVPMDNITDIDRRFTLFSSPVRSARHTGESCTLEDLHRAVASEHWYHKISPVRKLAPYKNEKDPTGKRKSDCALEYSQLKESTLPYAVLSGTWDTDHRHADGSTHKGQPCEVNGLISPSGMRLLDLDDLDSMDRAFIMSELRDGVVPWAAACWLSAGGDGLHLVATLDPAPACQADSHTSFAALVADLSRRLPVASVASDPAAKNLMRPSFVSCDPDAWLADSPRPLRWFDPPGDAHTGQKRHTENGHTRDTRQPLLLQLENVARDLVASGLDYNEWFGLMGALKSAGMDVAKLESISSAGGDRYEPGEIERKWEHLLHSDNPPAVVNGMAKHTGLRARVVDQARDTPTMGNTANDQDEDEDDKSDSPPGSSYTDPLRSPNTGAALTLVLDRVATGMTARRNVRSGLLEILAPDDWLRHRDYFRSAQQPDGWVPIDDMAAEALCDDIAGVVKKRSRPSAAKFLRMVMSLGSMTGHYADPFIDWLESLAEWDQDNRYADAAVVALKADPHARSLDWLVAATRIILNGAVQRAYQPGSIHDICVVLIGDEGTGKTTGMRELTPRPWQDIWYRKSLRLDRSQKEIIEDTRGYVIVECSELEGLDPRSRNRIKNLIDDPYDIAREAYGLITTKQARSFILVGTANDGGNGLFDIEGKQRRFWPVPTRNNVNLRDLSEARQWLDDHRDQLWAQALHEYKNYLGTSDSWRPPATLSAEHCAAVDEHRANTMGGDIAASLTEYVRHERKTEPLPLAHHLYQQGTTFTNAEAPDEVSAMLDRQQKLQREIASGLVRFGWRRTTGTKGAFRGRRIWVPPA